MAVIHGKFGRVRITAATPTSTTNLGTDLLTDKRTLILTDTTRRHWDPAATLLRVYGATTGTPLAAGTYTPDYVRGRVNFTTDHSTSVAYKVDAAWMPTSCLAVTRAWTLDYSVDIKDATVFTCSTVNSDWRTYLPGLPEATIRLDRLNASSESTAAPFIDRLTLQTPLFIELMPNATLADKWECYARIQADAHSVPVDDLLTESVTLRVDGPIYWTTST